MFFLTNALAGFDVRLRNKEEQLLLIADLRGFSICFDLAKWEGVLEDFLLTRKRAWLEEGDCI